VRLGGEFIYLGAYGYPSKVKYERLVAEWLDRGRIAINFRPPSRPEATVPVRANDGSGRHFG
jgi:hypothetical protein